MELLISIAALLATASAAPNFFFLSQGIPYGVSGGVVPYSSPIHLFPSAPVSHSVIPSYSRSHASAPQKPLFRHVDVQESTQFHSQDGRGQFLFGYSIPDQARIESRTSDGTVRGSYSYLDPVGRTITVQYIADDRGYHAATNEAPALTPGGTTVATRDHGYNLQYYAASAPNLVPASIVGSLPSPIEDTPEVAAAREAHLRLHQAALEAHAAAVAAVAAKDGGEQTPVKEVDFEEDVGEEVEEEDSTAEVNSGAASDESDEGVVIESDALSDNAAGAGISSYEDDDDHELTYEKDRYPKLSYTSLPETADPARVHDEESNSVIVTNPEFADEAVSTRIGGTEGQQTEGVEGQKEVAQVTGSIPGKGAFFYSFRHAVPVYVSVPQEQQHQYQEVLQGRLYGIVSRPAQQPPEHHHQQRLSVSQRASLLGAIPVAAVHDSQVSPTQRDSLKNHQTLPLYISPIEIEEN